MIKSEISEAKALSNLGKILAYFEIMQSIMSKIYVYIEEKPEDDNIKKFTKTFDAFKSINEHHERISNLLEK